MACQTLATVIAVGSVIVLVVGALDWLLSDKRKPL